MAELLQPFKDQLKQDDRFQCTDELQELFDESKQTIVKEIEEGVTIFAQQDLPGH